MDTSPHSLPEDLSAAPSSTDRKSPRWLILFKPKVGIPLAILITLASIPLAIRSWRISSLPPIDEPFDVEAFCSMTIPDEENAFVEYREAFDLFVEFRGKNSDWESYKDLVKGDWAEAPPAFVAWTKLNDLAFETWLKGTEKPNAMFVSRREIDFGVTDHLSEAKLLVRIALLRAGLHLRDGKTNEAWEILHAAFRFSRHIGQNGTYYERAAGISILPLVCNGLLSWSHHVNTSAADIDHAITVLSDEFASMTPPFSETLKYEYLASLQSLHTLGQDSWVFSPSPVIDSALIFVLGEPEYSTLLLDLVLANQLAGVDVAPSSRPAFAAGDDRIFDVPAVPGKRISGMELATILNNNSTIDVTAEFPSIKNSIFVLNLEQNFESTMIAVLSIESYVRKHARFPSSLEEFPKSLAGGLFADPYRSSNGNLIYRAGEEFAVVYSLGADGFDNGHSIAPPDGEIQPSWIRLDSRPRGPFEGYRIPLWRPAADAKADKSTAVVPDNVQD